MSILSNQDDLRTRALALTSKLLGEPAIFQVMPGVFTTRRRVCITIPARGIVVRVMEASQPNIDAMKRELAVSAHLAAHRAPVALPHATMPQSPIVENGLSVSLWNYVPHEKRGDKSALKQAAEALNHVHVALVDYAGRLPSFRDVIADCFETLSKDEPALPLSKSERLLLGATHDRLLRAMETLPLVLRPIHGDAHLGNVFFTDNGPLWSDFESVCVGPYEWDASCLSHKPVLPDLDGRMFSAISGLHSFCVAIWCAALMEIPDKKEAMAHHLARLRRLMKH